MKLTHRLGTTKISRKTKENIGFLLANKKGGFCNFYENPNSRHNGLFFKSDDDSRVFRTIESIKLLDKTPDEAINSFFFFEKLHGKIKESFLMPSYFNSFVYELNKESEIDIILDCKEIFDNRNWGRYYDIIQEKNIVIVKFTKRTDKREDSSNGYEEYSFYIAIRSDSDFLRKNDEWIERNYDYDLLRNSAPFSRHVYNGLRMRGKKFVFAFSKDSNEARKECNRVFLGLEKIKKNEKKNFAAFMNNAALNGILNNRKVPNEMKIAFANAAYSIEKLKSGNLFFAGLPWFLQSWSRDTLISLKAISMTYPSISKNIIMNLLNQIDDSGRLRNFDSSSSKSADSHGWLFLRSQLLLQYSSPKEKHEMAFEVESAIEKCLKGIIHNFTKDDFEFNNANETWMDTSYGNDNRTGLRIEIQALRLNIYKLMHELSQNPKHKIMENVLKSKVIQNFWNGSILADGINDFTIRPNIFIAAYAYPELLENEEWKKCFENSLASLWLNWGGLSTIDKKNPLYVDSYSGEDNRSYHRGDSWFWLNNLAAIVLQRTDRKKFVGFVKKIASASTEEILWKGSIGCHAELSSAKELSSRGCFNQLWSNAMYMEMVDEIFS